MSVRQFRRARIASVAVVAAGVTLAACGTSGGSTPSNPQAAVHQSVSGLTGLSGVGVRLSLGLTSSQLMQLTNKSSGGHMTQAEANAIASGSIFIDVATGHNEALHSAQAATDTSNSFDYGLQLGADTPVEYRVVAQNVFLHLELTQLLNDVGQSSSAQSTLNKVKSEGPALEQYVPGITSVLSGNWGEITKASLAPLLGDLKQLEAAQGGASANSNLAKADYTKISRDVAAALKANSTIAKVGSAGGRIEYSVTVNVTPFLKQVATALQNDLSSLPGGLGSKYGSSLNAAVAKVPSGQTVVMQVYTEANKLNEIDIDLNQFTQPGHKEPFAVPLKIAITDNPTIAAPSGATNLDLSKLPSLLGSLGGLGKSSSNG